MPSVNPEVKILADLEQVSRRAAEEFVQQANQAVHTKRFFTVALSGGSTPQRLYSLLANGAEPFRAQVPWDKIHFFWADERHVPPVHPDSNYRLASEMMLSKVPVPPEHVHRVQAENSSADTAAQAYEQELREFFHLEEGQQPRFDLVLLGMGPDGHTASLFPGTDVLRETKRLVAAPWVEKLHTYRISLTPPALNSAALIIFLVSGKEKAGALRSVLKGDYQPERFPAQLIHPISGRLLWLVDQAAADWSGSTGGGR
jgi:6-phosphogluconolactonase